jgi:hypothetical protein
MVVMWCAGGVHGDEVMIGYCVHEPAREENEKKRTKERQELKERDGEIVTSRG